MWNFVNCYIRMILNKNILIDWIWQKLKQKLIKPNSTYLNNI